MPCPTGIIGWAIRLWLFLSHPPPSNTHTHIDSAWEPNCPSSPGEERVGWIGRAEAKGVTFIWNPTADSWAVRDFWLVNKLQNSATILWSPRRRGLWTRQAEKTLWSGFWNVYFTRFRCIFSVLLILQSVQFKSYCNQSKYVFMYRYVLHPFIYYGIFSNSQHLSCKFIDIVCIIRYLGIIFWLSSNNIVCLQAPQLIKAVGACASPNTM